MAEKKILVVDDDKRTTEIIRISMERQGYGVLVAANGEEAIRRAQIDMPDLILLDVKMPDMDGYTCCESLKKHESTESIPVIMMSGLSTPMNKVRGFGAGAVDYVTKPINFDELAARVKTHVDLVELRSQLQSSNRGLESQVLSRTEKLDSEIRQRKDYAESLERTQQTLKVTLDSIEEVVITLDIDSKIVNLNKAACELIGAQQVELIGTDISSCIELFNPDTGDKILFAPEDITAGLSDRTFERECLVRINEEKECRVIFRLVRISNNHSGTDSGYVVILRDISKTHAVTQRIRQMEKMESIGQLAGGIAHDFNNILSAIRGAAEMLAIEYKDHSTVKQWAEIIDDSAIRASELIQKLMVMSRTDLPFSTVLDAELVVDEAVTLLQRTINKDIEIKRESSSEKSYVVGDPSEVLNMILNLCINARDAIEENGSISIKTSNVVFDEEYCERSAFDLVPGDYLRIEVCDDGCGMTDEVMARVFEPFFTTKAPGQGTGFGLSAVYGCISAHNGEILVESEVGKGTVFTINFPVSESDSVPFAIPDEIVTGSASVLVVEDEEIVRTTTSGMLEDLGCKVHAASGGIEALELYANHWEDIDVVILDLVMPKMSGRDVFFKFKEMNADVRVIISSGYSLTHSIQALIDAGAKGFLQKPYGLADLGKALNLALS